MVMTEKMAMPAPASFGKAKVGDELIFDNILETSYAGDKPLENTSDTIAFIYAVNKRIQEVGTVENIILDLSLNLGGSVHSAQFVIAWMLGEGFG